MFIPHDKIVTAKTVDHFCFAKRRKILSFRKWKFRLSKEVGSKSPIMIFASFPIWDRPGLCWGYGAISRDGEVFVKGHYLNVTTGWENVTEKVTGVRDPIEWLAGARGTGDYLIGHFRSMWKEETGR